MSERKAKLVELMFVDDSEADITLIRRQFERKRIRFTSTHCETGNEAQARLQDLSRSLPDIIFIDRRMKVGMQGDQLIEFIRGEANRAQFASCKVIVLSAMELTDVDIARYINLGVDVIFPKPLTAEHIQDMIEKSPDYYLAWMREV